MSSISELMRESWGVFKKSWLHLFVFNLIAWVVLGLVLFAGVILILASGAGAAFSAQQHNYALTGGLAIVGGIGGLLFVLCCIALGAVVQVGSMLIVSKKGQISLDNTIKQSIGFIIPALLVGIINSIIVFGGFFVFLIPGFLFLLFFLFSVYEVVFSNKKGLDALRSSMSIVTQNFWGIFGRLLLLVAMFFVISLIVGLLAALPLLVMDKTSVFAGLWAILFGIIRIVLNIALGFFSNAYFFTLYQHAKSAAKEGQSNLLWVGIVSAVGWVIFVLLMISFGGQLAKSFQEGLQKGKTPKTMQQSGQYSNYPSATTVTQRQADLLASDAFAAVNAYRKQKALPLFIENNRLCAYASRRLDAFVTAGKYDDGRGFYEDLADPKMSQAYFSSYYHIGELSTSINANKTGVSTENEGINSQATIKTVTSTTYTHACARADSKNIVVNTGGS